MDFSAVIVVRKYITFHFFPMKEHAGYQPRNRKCRIQEDRFIFTSSEAIMVKTALCVKLEAKPGKEKEVADFLRGALPLVVAEPASLSWYAIQFGPSTFGI